MKYLKEKGFTLVELMIVIVIVGILAAVAIPKFTNAADKARASEFPTILTGIYTQEEAFKAQVGTYDDDFGTAGPPTDIDMADPSGESKWFTYVVSGSSATAFTGTATVKAPFGKATTSDNATINQSGSKLASDNLLYYAPSWK